MTKKTDEDKIVYGTARGDVLRGGSGNDRIYALGGDDHIFAGDGNDSAEGGAGNDKIHGDDGNDTLLGGAGNDRLDGDDGHDWLDGGAGSDELDGGSGSDTLVYRLADHAGEATGARAPFSEIDGGSGCGVDTLQLVLTRAEWLRSDVQADVARALAFIAENTGRDGEAGSREFKFSAFNLEFERIEKLAVVVDGLAIDPKDEGVSARADTLTATEDAPSLALNLLANDTVPDLVRSVSVGTPARGTVTLTQDYSNSAAPVARAVYTPSPTAFQYLAAGERAGDSFTYTVTDADGDVSTATVTVTIQGVNDGPAIVSGSFAGAVTEDVAATLATGGTITFSDVDLTDTHSVTVGMARTSVTGTAPAGLPSGGYGQLTARVVETTTDQNPQGSIVWSFSADNAAVQGLAAGQTATQVYTLTLIDRAGASVTRDVTVTLTGTNDAPVVSGAVSGAATEDGPQVTLSALANARDVDAGAMLTVVNVPAALPAGVSYDVATKSFTLDPGHPAYQCLAQGQKQTVSVDYGVSDGIATTPASVSWTLTGANDAPIVINPAPVTVREDGAIVRLAALNAVDSDAGTALTVVNVPAELPAGVTYDPVAGVFSLDPSNAAYQSLGQMQSQIVTVRYGVSDGIATTPASVTWTVIGTNDAPVAVNDAAVTRQGTPVLIDVLANDTDADIAASLSIAPGSLTATNGTAVIQDGKILFTPNTGFFGEATISYRVSDGRAESASLGNVTLLVTPSTIDLAQVATGRGGFKIIGEGAGDRAGTSVSMAGDVNGDGLADILIGANRNDASGIRDAGAAYVVYGKAGGLTNVNLAQVAAGQGGFKIDGEAESDLAGQSVSAAGDVNGDGLADILVGAGDSDALGRSFSGAAYLVYGKAGGLTNVDLAQVAAGQGGFKIAGEAESDLAGWSVSAAGDVNGDGFADILVGATENDALDRPFSGAAYVVYGKAGGLTNVDLAQVAAGQGGFKIAGQNAGNAAGQSVSAAGDVNGDGFADILVGAPLNGTSRDTRDAGAAYVVYGTATEIPSSQTVFGTAGNEVLRGGSGDDRIAGLGGNDRLTGGAGADTFVFRPIEGQDFISDFDTNRDVIELARSEFADFTAVLAHANQVGSDTVITLDAGHSLTLQGVTRTSLAADDFLFA